MNKSKARLRRALTIFVGLLAANIRAVAQTKIIDVTVDDPRPLAAAILKIEDLSGIPINYEDMPVYYSGDVEDITNAIARTPPRPGAPRIMGQRSGQLSVPIVVDATTGKLTDVQAVQTALTAVVAAYNSSKLPGGFDFELYNGVFFVKPVRYRDASGATQPMTPILSTPIAFAEQLRTSGETYRLILKQISGATTVEISPGMGLGGMGTVIFGAQNEPANHVIARYLAGGSGPAVVPINSSWDNGMSYRFFFDATRRSYYVLNVHQVVNSPRWEMPEKQPYAPPVPKHSGSGAGVGAAKANKVP